MKKNLLLVIITFAFANLFAQNPNSEIKTLFDQGENKKIIELYNENFDNLSSKSLFYLASANYNLDKKKIALKFLNNSSSKNEKDPEVYYLKGLIYSYYDRKLEGFNNFEIAYKLEPENYKYCLSIANYYHDSHQYTEAIKYYDIAKKLANGDATCYFKLAELYRDFKAINKALQTLYEFKDLITPKSEYYIKLIYDIALLEDKNQNYDVAESFCKEIITLDPNIYYAHIKLIKLYNKKQAYAKAEPHIKILNQLHQQGILNNSLYEKHFIIDYFIMKDNHIKVYQNYNPNPDEIFTNRPKNFIIVFDEDGGNPLNLQTVISTKSNSKYILEIETEDGKKIDSGIEFDKNYSYKDLKNEALKILKKHL